MINLIKRTEVLHDILTKDKLEGKTIGFVPTMGALHEGHLKLVEQAKTENDICVVSIFVNPTQFNNQEDLIKYPRTLERDLEILEPLGVDYVFAPGVEEIYPQKDNRIFDFAPLDSVMEGFYRPGHFNGVAQVVSRLFDIINPTRAYFGQKDFQQLAIIKALVREHKYPIDIVSVPIVRDDSGLALSSRNERLSEEQKKTAVAISTQLMKAKRMFEDGKTIPEIKERVIKAINDNEDLEVEYFDIVDGNSLQSIAEARESDYIVACVAVYCGNVRLIDNIILKQ